MIAALMGVLLVSCVVPLEGFSGLPVTNGLGAVGEWVTYRMSGAGRDVYLRLAVVGEEQDGLGRPAVWMELEWGEHPELASPLAQIRFLAARGRALEPDSVTRVFFAHGHD